MRLFGALGVFFLSVTCLHAEKRGAPCSPKELHDQSALVFEGTVEAVEMDANGGRAISFPKRARVKKVLKGETDAETLTFGHKNPGRHAIFKQEYNPPLIDQEGTFYLQDQRGNLILIGYIKKAE